MMRKHYWLAAMAAALAASAGVTCGTSSSREQRVVPETATTEPPAPPNAQLPAQRGEQPPAMAVLGDADGRVLADVGTCGGCHADVFAQQQASAHAFASLNNPIYRGAVERTRREAGDKASLMCASCHDVPLLSDEIAAGIIDPADDRAHAGVTCRVCHGIDEVTRSGNGSYTMSERPFVLPRDGDPASVAAHKRSVAPLRSADLCASCHRSFLHEDTGNHGVFVTGLDDFGSWLGSAYNGSELERIDDPIAEKTCTDCHMADVPAPLGDAAAKGGRIASHRFVGGHTWLASMVGDQAQLDSQRANLEGTISLDWAGISIDGGALRMPVAGSPAPVSSTAVVDLVMRNRSVGHVFPAGVTDAQDTWVAVELRDARGRLLAQAGQRHADGDHTDMSAHVLRTLMVDEDGVIRFLHEAHAFRAAVVSHALAPRDALAVRYRFAIPRGLPDDAYPLTLRGQLLHRTRNLLLQADACAESRSARGKRFKAKARQLGQPVLDPCRAQPVTVIAAAEAELGPGARAAQPTWLQAYEHGLALLHSRQEHVQDARAPLELARSLLASDPAARPRDRAAVVHALGRLASLEGRANDALALFDQAEKLVGHHPAIDYGRGQATARVWRWAEAAEAFQRASEGAPENVDGWVQLAMALGSLDRETEALAAAQRGLALFPRQADLLRVQALALKSLGADDSDPALVAYDDHRPPDYAYQLRITCAANDEMCELERDPVHVHDLVPVRR